MSADFSRGFGDDLLAACPARDRRRPAIAPGGAGKYGEGDQRPWIAARRWRSAWRASGGRLSALALKAGGIASDEGGDGATTGAAPESSPSDARCASMEGATEGDRIALTGDSIGSTEGAVGGAPVAGGGVKIGRRAGGDDDREDF